MAFCLLAQYFSHESNIFLSFLDKKNLESRLIPYPLQKLTNRLILKIQQTLLGSQANYEKTYTALAIISRISLENKL